MSAAYNFTPVHVITCYLEPQNKKMSDKGIRYIEYVLQLILGRLPYSRIILCGDFNERRHEVDKIMDKCKLQAIIPEGNPTHSRGNHLD